MNDGTAGPGSRSAPTRSRPRRIGSICRVLWNGGVQRAAIGQTLGLRALGENVDLIFLREVPGVAYDLPAGTQVLSRRGRDRPTVARELSLSITRLFAAHRGADASVDLDLLWRARSAVLGHDVVVYNDQYAALLGVWERLVRGRPFVTMFHEFYPRVSGRWRRRWLAPLADTLDLLVLLAAPAIVTTSRQVQERIERIVPGRTYLARLGAPTPPSDPPSLKGRDRRQVFSITVWDRGRHPERFLELADALPEIRFVVAGIWTDPRHLAEFRTQAARRSNLVVTGPVSEEERERLLNASLIYLRLGYSESGPGMGGLEALAAGSIVIANRGLGLSESLTDGVNGFVVDLEPPGRLVELLRSIVGLSDEALCLLSVRARDLARRQSWEAHSYVLVRALDRAMGVTEATAGAPAFPGAGGPGPLQRGSAP